MTKGRKRYSEKYPTHIDRDKLPTGIEYIPSGNGFFRVAYYDDFGKQRYKRLCAGSCTYFQIVKAYEAFVTKAQDELTFKMLSLDFQKTRTWRELNTMTQKDYEYCHNKICDTKLGKYLFGDIPYRLWKTSLVLKYQDFRAEESKSRANKELAYIKRVLSWAKLYEKISENLAEKIPKLHVPPRQHVATEKDFNFLLQTAKESNYWYMPYLITISYECSLRLCEAVELNDSRELPEGLKIIGRKGSRTNIIRWGEKLRSVWDEAKVKRNQIYKTRKMPIPMNPENRYLFISERTGDPLSESSIKTAKDRIDKQAIAKASRLGIDFKPFTLHDIKRSAISHRDGTTAEKLDASRHKTPSMLDVYDVSVKTVKSTTESKN